MSLKSFHLVFVSVCLLMSAFVAYWGFTNAEQHLTLGLIFAAATIVIFCYGIWGMKKFGKEEGVNQ